jgi:hypothetical protein
MSPLVSLTLLGFGSLLVTALLAWALLASPRRRPDAAARADPHAPPEPRATVTNDAVRGARVRATDRPKTDAFERFLEADRDDR